MRNRRLRVQAIAVLVFGVVGLALPKAGAAAVADFSCPYDCCYCGWVEVCEDQCQGMCGQGYYWANPGCSETCPTGYLFGCNQ